ncbi:MAG: hypothetical protein KDC87_17765 [Planctomycetes bacterium]|nr:hypothetical protein [Planctomycetota bacterium]MCB9871973.1 hypothetical protein [Planctomycetota bacterium]MCB9889528.1 hypothetical protein [Planctomycetota bacterium]
MRIRPLPLALLAAVCSPAPGAAQKGVSLTQLTEIAKSRSERIRPELLKKLAPHLEVLSKDREREWVAIDAASAEVVKLGDTIIPLLLEKLDPRSGRPEERNLARNCAGILAKLDPASFVDALIDILEGERYDSETLVVPLLGLSGSPRAGEALTRMMDRADPRQKALILQALAKLNYRSAALVVAKQLPFAEERLNSAAVAYLEQVAAPVVVPEVRRVLKAAKLPSQIMLYARLLGRCSKEDIESADVLLEFFKNTKLDRVQLGEVARILGTVAPVGHDPTIERLRSVIKESENPGDLELDCAITLRRMGDKQGPEKLRAALISRTRSPKTKRQFIYWNYLGDYYLAFDQPKQAATAFRKAYDNAQGENVRTMLQIKLARAEARQSHWTQVRNALRDSRGSLSALQQELTKHPELAEAAKHRPVKEFLESFPK